MSNTNQICITCTQRDTCQYYDPNRTICVPVITEQEMQLQIAIEQGKVNALRQEVAEMNKERECQQHCRIQFVGQIASAIVSNYEFYAEGIAEECKRSGKSRPEMIAQMSLEIADALVAEMKRSDDVYAECRRMDAINTASVCENMTKIQKELQKKGD